MSKESAPLKILVADDDSLVRDMLQDILASAQHVVSTAVDGADALRQLTPERGIDIVVSDMDMPGMNGLELLRRLREAGNPVPVIILTGNQEVRLAIEALKNGANDYLLKDESIEDTVGLAISSVMEMHRLKIENLRLLEDLARKNQELERMALLDGLTGVPNRRYFDRTILQEFGRAARDQTPIAAVMVDIDFFKTYNDTYGHQQGDACLQKVAAALTAGLKRPSDFIARYGGEEFVAVLPNTTLEGAMVLSEVMRENVEKLALEHKASKVCPHVTASLGVACLVPDRGTAYAHLLRKADQALYAAKRGGRNRCQAATHAQGD